MRTGNRKSAPEVKGGKVQKKNDWALTPNYYSHVQRELVIDRKRPGPGYRHVLTRRHIEDFIRLLPDWPELSRGLDAIVLAPGDPTLFGYHTPGVVHICALNADLWVTIGISVYHEDRYFFERLSVPCVQTPDGYQCRFTGETARAYQLLNIFLHELGHHRDRMGTKSGRRASHGEPFALRYAEVNAAHIWDAYRQHFDLP